MALLTPGLVSGATDSDKAHPQAAAPSRAKHLSLLALSDKEVAKRVAADISSLGSLSIGLPNNGRLLNGVQPEDGAYFEVVVPDFTWGTAEMVAYLETAVKAVHAAHPNTPPLHVGHISAPGGGYLSPHLSHQSGRDVDLGYYYTKKRAWYRRATWDTLDVPRTWTLVKAMVTQTDVEMILIDSSIQSLLKKYALAQGEDKLWVHKVFNGSAERPAIIRHVRGHATHIHARFFSPVAQANAQRAYPFLLEHELVKPVVMFEHHRVRKGETLGRLAKKYGTTVQAIQQANGLRGTLIQAKKVYKIPLQGGPAPLDEPLEFPGRLLPPG